MPLRAEPQQHRIVMTADAVGGVWSYAIDLVRELAPYGIEVLLAVMGPLPDLSQQREAARIQNLELTAKPFALEWYTDVSDAELQRSGEWLQSLASSFHANIVHINGYAQASQHWDVPTVVVAHSCVYSWWLSVHGEFPPASWTPYRRRVMEGLRSASAVVAPTAWMLKTLERLYGRGLPNAQVVRNFSGLPVQTIPKEPFIFSCGRLWDESKNMLFLDGIARSLDWPLHMAGHATGPEGSQVTLEGAHQDGVLTRAEMSDRFAKAAIFAHPARYEPFGLAVLEAARNACALVLADVPPLRELWDGCALFASPGDRDKWTHSLNRASRDSAMRGQLSRRALERSSNYGAIETAAQYVEVYNSLARPTATAFPLCKTNEASHQTLLPLHHV